ncbi:hypothetical protein FGO68_gene6446 [Halteria grandinella]|uniref:Uncharacterized protein n=1 Tax=Halteria grandinella TaxID=5974 RepID=A0A8J8T9Q1_HALGN|nr:hypothetical protein FGO68_gene6446 [Halteria grandinella]
MSSYLIPLIDTNNQNFFRSSLKLSQSPFFTEIISPAEGQQGFIDRSDPYIIKDQVQEDILLPKREGRDKAQRCEQKRIVQ